MWCLMRHYRLYYLKKLRKEKITIVRRSKLSFVKSIFFWNLFLYLSVKCTGLAILSLYCSWNFPPAIFWYYLRYANRKFYAKNWTSLRGARVFANDLFDFAAFPIENVWKMAKNRVFWKKTYQNRLETTFWYIKSTLHVSLHPSRLF